jgi:Fe(3+) dicitrate transport protein
VDGRAVEFKQAVGLTSLALCAGGAAAQQSAIAQTPTTAQQRLEIPEIVVIGEASNLRTIPGSANVLDQSTLDASRVFTTNEALRKVPGIYARDEEGFGLRPNIGVRGLNPTRSSKVLLLEDGLPLTYAPYGDNASYYHPPIDRFERIEVLKGSGQVLFGPQTIGGVINYITPRPSADLAGTVALQGGNRDYRELHARLANTIETTSYAINVTRKQTDGARKNMHFEVGDISFKLVHDFSEQQALTFRASYYDENSDVPYSGLSLAEYQADPRANPFVNDNFTLHRWGSSVTHQLDIGAAAVLSTSLYYTSLDRDWWRQASNSNQRPNDASDPACGGMVNLSTTCGNEGRQREYSTAGIEPRLTVHHKLFGASSEAELGLRYHTEDQFRIQANGDTPTARVAGSGPNAGTVEDNTRDVEAWSMFLQNRFLLGRWTLTPGVRFEQIDYFRRNNLTGTAGRTEVDQWIPGLGATYAVNDATTVFVGAHRGFGPPAVADILTNSGGSVDLDPELSWNYEVGVRSTLRPGLSLEATLFRMDFENQVISASLAGGVGSTLTNAGETLHEGAELMFALETRELRGTARNVFLRTAYTLLTSAEFRGVRYSGIPGSTTVSVTGNRLPYAPEQLLTITAGVELPSGFTFELEGVFNDEVFTDDLNTVGVTTNGQQGLIPSFTVWNATVNYALRDTGWTFFLTAKNLADELYVADMTRGMIPGTPQLVQGGITYRF